jgi:hypothetical protein
MDVVKTSTLGGVVMFWPTVFLEFWPSIRIVSRKYFQIFFDQNKQGLQLFPRKHDHSLEIVKIANDFITLTIFYLKLWPNFTNFDLQF